MEKYLKVFDEVEQAIDDLSFKCEQANNSLFKRFKFKGLVKQYKEIIVMYRRLINDLQRNEERTSEVLQELFMKRMETLNTKINYLDSQIHSYND